MKLYKLTDENDQTQNSCQWGENITHETSGEGKFCGPGFTHWYLDPLLAVFLNPIHGDFDPKTMHLWEGKGEIVKNDHGLKVGCTKATTLRRISLPEISTENRIKIAILCTKQVCKEQAWNTWADNWLSGKDRTRKSATAASAAASASAAAAAAASAAAAAWASASAAAWAAWAAAWAAWAAEAKAIDLLKIIKENLK
ncbi:MAG: hypothetical protein M0R80_13300 [Proteobacteria bacterium]|jgi:hypothetical protein|nr:hypothetical protein [Pseudomonadota bacterium]